MQIKELNYLSSQQEKTSFIDAYLAIWNNQANLKYLSYTGQVFLRAKINSYVSGLNKDSDVKYFYAIVGKQLAGIIVVSANRIHGYNIGGLGVLPKWKRKGIGSALVDGAIKSAKSMGFKAMETIVYSENQPMLLLVIKKGFQPVGVQYAQRYDGANTVSLKLYWN